MFSSKAKDSGALNIRHIKTPIAAPLSWKVRNILRFNYLWNFFWFYAAKLFTKVSGIVCLTGRLKAVLIRDGRRIDYGVVAHGLVTTAWVNFVVDNLQTETSEFGDLKFHDSGVGTTGAAVGDTDMETTDGEARVTGTQTENGANVYQTVGTITYTTTKAITEHGVFTQVTGGTMVDRHTFSAINVVNTDQIEFTYEYTATAGG